MNDFPLADVNPPPPSTSDFVIKQEPVDVKPSPYRSVKRKASFGDAPFSDDEFRSIRQRLDIGLTRAETMQRPGPGGMRITYVEGWKVIHEANQIFGFNGWSSQIVQLDTRYVEENRGRFSACVSATVRITLRDGCTREDRGGGLAENMRSKGEAIMKADKEAVTDATKRALKNFGLRLGLSLYDRQHVRDMNRPSPRESMRDVDATHASAVASRPISAHQPRYSPKQRAQSAAAFRKPQPSAAVMDRSKPPNMVDKALSVSMSTAMNNMNNVMNNINGAMGSGREQQVQAQALLKKQVMPRSRANQDTQSMSEALANIQKRQRAHASLNGMQQLNVVAANFGGALPTTSTASALSAPMTDRRMAQHLQQATGMSASSAGRVNPSVAMQNANVNVNGTFGGSNAQYGVRGTAGLVGGGQHSSSVSRARGGSARSAAQNASINLGVTIGLDNAQGISLQASGAAEGQLKSELDTLHALALAEFQ
ncbi:DNA repair protein RAD52-like [Gracilariopsis chorda]|uniref:DNA repair protein RAD52-like n=1 Tax=Gracilariopsis chorda TaxID=448386 RepID=A0A2V3IJ57_9FLOR|nr:DNA repair protein RAD52-like [Gracilariopsis chorda]|eukprot:PXF42102.1 DNA repair protein RAD52-like [Gracilariopsis chorda]